MNATMTVNGRSMPWRDVTIDTLMTEAGYARGAGGVAVARNGVVVPHAEWPVARLEPGDTVEIVEIVRGG